MILDMLTAELPTPQGQVTSLPFAVLPASSHVRLIPVTVQVSFERPEGRLVRAVSQVARTSRNITGSLWLETGPVETHDTKGQFRK